MRCVGMLLGLLVVLAAGGPGAIYLGLFEVAATTPHGSVTDWALSTAMQQGIERRARGVSVPSDLDTPARIRAGASSYDAMCVVCHAGPGVEADAMASGLLPEPPELADEAHDWSAAELFWILEHGIRMTGMAAFGPTHSDEELWDLVAFLRRLPSLSPAEYRSLTGSEGDGGGRHEHSH